MPLSFLIFINIFIGQAGMADLFELSKEVLLPANVQLSQVEFVDVDQHGNLLITDQSTENVILYLSDSESFLELDPDECHPGFSFHPIRAHFVDDEVWVFNRQSEVFRFYENGDCKGVYPNRFDAPDFFTPVNETLSAGIMPQNYDLSRPALLLYDRESGKVAESISLEEMVAPNMAFRYGAGGMFAHQNRIYFAVSSAPVIYSYHLDEKKITIYEPEELSQLSIVRNEDIGGNPVAALREVQSYLKSYTTTLHFDKLNSDYAILHAEKPDRSDRELLLFDLNTKEFVNSTYNIGSDSDEFYQAFGNSKAYSIVFRDEEDSWVLQVYDVTISGN